MAGTNENVQPNMTESEPPIKKQKLVESTEADEVKREDLKDLSSFKPDRILSCDSRSKTIVALGSFTQSDKSDDRALVILEKKAFDAEGFEKYCSDQTTFKKVFRNDVYGNYDCFLERHLNGKRQHIAAPEPCPRRIWGYVILDCFGIIFK